MPSTFWARIDSGSANNPALNLTGDPAVWIEFVASGQNGDLFLDQPTGGGIDPDTQILIGGTTYNFTFVLSGTMPTLKRDGSQQVPDQFEGSIVYIITVQDYSTPGATTRLMFMPEETATHTEMDSFGNGAIDVQNVDVTPAAGPVCFAGGTHILTPQGEVLVEDLKVGDLVVTRDDGPQPILWISSTKHSWPLESDKSKPIKIAAGALGPRSPRRDLVVSPQHKVLLSGPGVRDHFGEDEILAPAKGLLSLPGIRVMKGKRDVAYYHILLPRHSILISDGAPTESFYPGPCALEMLKRNQRDEIFAALPKLKHGPERGSGPQARVCLSRAEAERLAMTLINPTPMALAA